MESLELRLIGHQRIRDLLDRTVGEKRVHHAYLLHGAPGVGKSTLARWLAMRLNCPQPVAPCGTCRTCARIRNGVHPDVRSLQPASDRDPSLGWILEARDDAHRTTRGSRIIGVDDVRALQRDASLAPNEAAWKVYLVVGAESLNLEAANCLLKTLEEPPPHVVLILIAADTLDLLPTILSRCQVIRLSGVPAAAIAAALVERGVDSAEADLLARLAGGRPGWALQAASDPRIREERLRALHDLEGGSGRNFRERLALAEQIAAGYSKDPHAVLDTLAIWQLWWWDVALVQDNCAELITNVDQRERLRQAAAALPGERVRAHLRQVALASQRLVQNVNPRLALEALLVAAPVLP